MNSLRTLIVLLCCTCVTFGLLDMLPSHQGNNDVSTLPNHVLQLEQALSSLQTETEVREEKYAATLSGLLSKLSETADKLTETSDKLTNTTTELESLKSESKTMQENYSALQIEFISVKTKVNKNEDQFTKLTHEVNSNTYNMSLLQTNITDLRSNDKASEVQLRKVVSELALVRSDLDVSMDNLTSVVSEVANLKPEVSKVRVVQAEVNHLKATTNSTSHGLKVVEAQIRGIVSSRAHIHSELTGVHKAINMLNESVSHIHLASSSNNTILMRSLPQVAFEVEQTANPIGVLRRDVIHFDHIKNNAGNGYSDVDGKFTAPVSGNYLFWICAIIRNYTGSVLTVDIMSTDKRLGTASTYIPQLSSPETLTLIAVAHIEKGQKVWFMPLYSGKTIVYNKYSSYGGVLLASY